MYAVADNAALIRPFAILAAAGFAVGFAGYLAVGRPDIAAVTEARAPPPAVAATTSGVASDEWNLPKRI
jgi:hypothetical protein